MASNATAEIAAANGARVHVAMDSPVTTPLDNADLLLKNLEGLRLGLITNHTGVDRSLTPGALSLSRIPGIKLERLFAPEHGIYGDVLAGGHVPDGIDPLTGLPIVSLYGSGYAPKEESLLGLDALLFDIQDLGVRYYTYVWTMAKCMEAAARYGLRFFVLDRPNPLNGTSVEGNLSRHEWSSLVGLYPIAARHGLTVGELAQYINGEFGLNVDLCVLPMTGWRRGMWFDQTGLTFIPASPNTTGMDMATLYTGTCLIEGTNVSEGRGTTKPFEAIGAPWIDPFLLWAKLNEYGLPGVMFRPVYFVPASSKYQGIRCGGVQVHVTGRHLVDSFELGLWLLFSLRDLCGFKWRDTQKPQHIDLLFGTDEIRVMLDEGKTPPEILQHLAPGLSRYRAVRDRYLIYREE